MYKLRDSEYNCKRKILEAQGLNLLTLVNALYIMNIFFLNLEIIVNACLFIIQ